MALHYLKKKYGDPIFFLFHFFTQQITFHHCVKFQQNLYGDFPLNKYDKFTWMTQLENNETTTQNNTLAIS